jgi:CDP-glucose 4,6-dehydratase
VEIRAGAVEDLGMNRPFWDGKKVFMTGNTGFNGSLLSLWLLAMGTQVHGYALEPSGGQDLFNLCGLQQLMPTCCNNIADLDLVRRKMQEARSKIVFHLEAQPFRHSSRSNNDVNVNPSIQQNVCIRIIGSVQW